jgi:hypothetical protein
MVDFEVDERKIDATRGRSMVGGVLNISTREREEGGVTGCERMRVRGVKKAVSEVV